MYFCDDILKLVCTGNTLKSIHHAHRQILVDTNGEKLLKGHLYSKARVETGRCNQNEFNLG